MVTPPTDPHPMGPHRADLVRAPHPALSAYYATADGKQRFVRDIFDAAAEDYGRIEHLLAFGAGRRYRRQALVRAGLTAGMHVLDVAVGTGLVALEAARVVGPSGYVSGIDPSPGMMAAAAGLAAVPLVQGRAESLPFRAGAFDFISFGFALRHVDDLGLTFQEFRRVLKPGGRLLILEITRPTGRIAGALIKLHLGRIVPMLAQAVARHQETVHLFRYYWDTIEACASPESVLATLRGAGFTVAERHVELAIFSEYRAQA